MKDNADLLNEPTQCKFYSSFTFEMDHNKTPRGFGSWAFKISFKGHAKLTDRFRVAYTTGMYAEERNQVIKHAKQSGATCVTLMS